MEIKNKNIRVRCLECKEENSIEIANIGFEKEQRSFGIEYAHYFKGKKICNDCSEKIRINITVYEYPKNYISYIDCDNKFCIITEEISEESFIV